jgi:hypothetical protein
MKQPLIVFLFICITHSLFAQKSLPNWSLQAFKKADLDKMYDISSYMKPAFLLSDLNGDHILDLVVLVVHKKSKKRGILIIHQGSGHHYLIGAGSKFGKKAFDEFDDLKWMDNWHINKKKKVYETRFENGDIVGSIPRILKNNSIEVWEYQDGAPLAGGIIYWDGKKYNWIHQGD